MSTSFESTSSRSSAGTVKHAIELAVATVPPLHPAGKPFVLGAALGTLILRMFSRKLGVLGLVLTALCAWFFREPRRMTPTESGIAVAPADGTIAQVISAAPPLELGLGTEPMLRISVFLNIFDVHVQRVPATGTVREVCYRPGKFLSADLDKASEDNERNAMLLRTETGEDLVVVQIAGMVARRIVCSVAAGDAVTAGGTYGMIRFGSRVDLYVPLNSRVLVRAGQRAIGGETIFAELPSKATE